MILIAKNGCEYEIGCYYFLMKKRTAGRPNLVEREMLEIRKRITLKFIDQGYTQDLIAKFLHINKANISILLKNKDL